MRAGSGKGRPALFMDAAQVTERAMNPNRSCAQQRVRGGRNTPGTQRFASQPSWLLAAALFVGGAASPAAAIDWESVAKAEFVLFYPGQASIQWTLDSADGSGPPAGHPSRAVERFREGQNCSVCHDLSEDVPKYEWGADIVRDDAYLGPAADPAMPHYTEAEVQGVHDNEQIHLRISWRDPSDGTSLREDGYQSAVAFFLSSREVLEGRRTGCWATCHDDLKGMPNDRGLTMYLPRSRTAIDRTGGGENYRSDRELADLLADGHFLEYWQVLVAEDKAPRAGLGYVLEGRNMDFDSGALTATAQREGDHWVVEMSRPLGNLGPGTIAMAPGETFYGGMAIHNGGKRGRHHYVTMEFDVSIGHPPRGKIAIQER